MAYDYNGPEIISILEINPLGVRGGGKIKQRQKVQVKCFNCGEIKSVIYSGHVFNRLHSKCDVYMCHSCQSSHNMIRYNNSIRGVSMEERLGVSKSQIVKEKLKKYAIDNNISSRLWNFSGISWDDKYGIDYSNELKQKLSERAKVQPRKFGPDNPQWGKPAHKLSGSGTKGYYNGIYFRSLLEASFMVNYLEPNNLIFENGELRKYAIPYTYNGTSRNYFCDFVVGKCFYEVKPKSLFKSLQNIAKWDAARKWCLDHGYDFKIFSEHDFPKFKQKDIDNLKESGKIVLL